MRLLRFDVVTLFPELFAPFMAVGVARRAFDSGRIVLRCWNPRDFAEGNYRRVDDRPFGGGPGMVMLAEPLARCLQAIRAQRADPPADVAPVLLFSPIGEVLRHRAVERWAASRGAVLICGRYEGIDQRVVDHCHERYEVIEVSLGDYVLNGGEVAALAIIEAVSRLLPGVIGNPESLVEESHSADADGLLEYPVYTKPASWRGLGVPEVLLSGHHGHVAAWRRAQSIELTRSRRPDLIKVIES